MTVSLETPSVYQRCTGNETRFELEGATIGELVDSLLKIHPEARETFLDRDGNILPKFRIFINGKPTYPPKKDTPVNDGDKVSLMMIVTGG